MPPAHQKINIEGTLGQADGGGSEIFSFGMACASGMSAQALATLLGPKLSDWLDNGGHSNFNPSVAFTGIRVEEVQADGTVSSSYYISVGSINGSGNNIDPCTILSHAVTLETDTAGSRGRMVRGRFYPPGALSVQGATTTTALAEGWANSFAGLINGFNDAGANVAVASETNGGAIAPVVAVTVDTIVDTIRRRKNHVTGARSPRVAITS